MSLATHAAAAPDELKFPMVAVVVLLAVCRHTSTVALCVVISAQVQAQPLSAVGSPMTPLVAEPPVPTLIVKAAGFTPAAMLGVDPKPLLIVGVPPG
jgi:hypothetical protein